jgi:hypothetical protein
MFDISGRLLVAGQEFVVKVNLLIDRDYWGGAIFTEIGFDADLLCSDDVWLICYDSKSTPRIKERVWFGSVPWIGPQIFYFRAYSVFPTLL